MASLEMKVKVTEIEPVMKILKATKELVEQVEMNDYQDSLGHPVKMNKAYIDLKEALSNLQVKEAF